MIKCANGFNHYGLRYAMINNNMIEANYPRCNQVEMLDYVIKCNKIIELRRDFIQELVAESVKAKPIDISEDLIMLFVKDTLRYIENEEKEDYKTNKNLIGMMELFQGYVVVVWKGT